MTTQKPREAGGVPAKGRTPPPTSRRVRCKLDSLTDIKREMSMVYRQARSEIIDPVSAAKLIWCLTSIAKIIEGSDLEKRIAALEAGK